MVTNTTTDNDTAVEIPLWLRRALRLALHLNHGWASCLMATIPECQGARHYTEEENLALFRFGGRSMRASSEHIRAYYNKNSTDNIIPGIPAPNVEDDFVVHETGTGRLSYRIDHEGEVYIEVTRPGDETVGEATIYVPEEGEEARVRIECGGFARHFDALSRAISAVLGGV